MCSSEMEVLRDIKAMEETMKDHILYRYPDSTLAKLTAVPCLTQMAQELREKGWGLPLEGITMPAQQEQTQICEWGSIPVGHYDKAISLSLEGDPTTNWHLTRGPVPPYIGAPTRIRAKR